MTISTGRRNVLLLASWILLLAGYAVLFGMLSAPAGVWIRLWPHVTALAILDVVHPFTAITAAAMLLLGITLYLARRKSSMESAGSFLWLHLIAAVGCAVVWYIPVSYQQTSHGSDIPPIHDVSTDVVDIPQFVAIVPQRIDAATSVYGGSPGMTEERNIRLQREAYPDLMPRFYAASTNDIYYRAYSAALAMGWDIVAAAPDEGRIEATDTTFWFRLKEDVVIRIRDEDDLTRVDARSLSRMSGSDGGTNARRLSKFFKLLDAGQNAQRGSR